MDDPKTKEQNVMKAPRLWLRWVLVLPVAFTIDMLTQSITHGLSSLLVPKSLEPFINFLIWWGLGPLAFIAGGVLLAPKYKFVTSSALGGFKVAVAIYNTYTFFAGGGSWNDLDSLTESPFWWNMCVYTICIIGIIALCVFVKKSEERKDDGVRRILSGFFKICGEFYFVIFSLWGCYLSLRIVGRVAGFLGFVIGFTVLPVTFVAAPLYEGIVRNDWFPCLISYSGLIIGGIFFWLGSLIAGD